MTAKRGFTLVELLVVVGIIGTLVGILVPTYGRVMELAREAECGNNLKLVSQAIMGYLAANRDLLPGNDTGATNYPEITIDDVLPGGREATAGGAKRWWANKVFNYGTKSPRLYVCQTIASRADVSVIRTNYGFNDTLTQIDRCVNVHNITDTHRTALVGHCTDATPDPAIIEAMVATNDGSLWSGVHARRLDSAGRNVGRGGFIMASGSVETYYWADAQARNPNNANQFVLFHK